MIDVTFLLLVYFIVSTILTPPEEKLTAALKVEEGSSINEEPLEPQIIQVQMKDGTPEYVIADQIYTTKAELSRIISLLPRDPGLIVRVHNNVPVGFAVVPIQVAKDADFEKVTYVPVQ
jgi:biopolymer transport protein ExbD